MKKSDLAVLNAVSTTRGDAVIVAIHPNQPSVRVSFYGPIPTTSPLRRRRAVRMRPQEMNVHPDDILEVIS